MKRTDILIILTFFLLVFGVDVRAQERTTVPAGYVLVDSVIYRPVATVDTTLVGKDVFLLMPTRQMGDNVDVKINQTEAVKDAMRRQVVDNEARTLSGYRVRIFFDNKQTARAESEKILKDFRKAYPEIAVYRVYANPYFKVTVGDFRTRSEAMEMLSRIKYSFPSAFVVKENIDYPAVDSEHAVVVDTIKVLKRR